MKNDNIIFVPVHDSEAKLQAIVEAIQRHFYKRERIIIRVDNAAAAAYVDKLLWRIPQAGILPHTIISSHCRDPIAIIIGDTNWNNASVLLNLGSDIHPEHEQFNTIYELQDYTSPEKLTLSTARMDKYSQKESLSEMEVLV